MYWDTANKIFWRVYKGHANIMTPMIVDRGMSSAVRAWEISRGENIMGDGLMHGVTVIDVDVEGNRYVKRNDINRLFNGKNSYERAKAFCKGLDRVKWVRP